jgi:hypothetical protein
MSCIENVNYNRSGIAEADATNQLIEHWTKFS